MNELAGQNLGGYQVEEEIGRGSMGVVYRGTQIALGREVAIKVLPWSLAQDASYVARFIREAQIIARLNHPNIVQIYDAGQQNKLLYFVMEYIQGPTLASLLSIDGVLPQHLAVTYAAQIADALDAAYRELHVIHRDIKPENLMLNRWGQIKVMDFGLARAIGHRTITMARALVGSLYYASPEQILGHTLDNRSDIYALGVVLYEMVTGHRPFPGRSMPDVTRAILQQNPPLPRSHNPEIDPRLERIILTTLSKDRRQRYEHTYIMAQMLRDLHLNPSSTFSGTEVNLSAQLPLATQSYAYSVNTPQLPFPIQMESQMQQVQPGPSMALSTHQPSSHHQQEISLPLDAPIHQLPSAHQAIPKTETALQIWQPPRHPLREWLERLFHIFHR